MHHPEGDAGEGYHDHSRPDVCELVARYAATVPCRVLDLGCGSGRLGESLKHRGLAEVVHGIELDAEAAELARHRLDKVWGADLSRFDWEELDRYDVVVAADVLEHLPDPWRALRRLHAVLAPGGRVVASIPNVRYWKVIADLLLKGEFRYVEEGCLIGRTSGSSLELASCACSKTQGIKSSISSPSRSNGQVGSAP